MVIGFGFFVALILIAGAGPWLWENLGSALMGVVHILSLIFILSSLAHIILLPPLWLLRIALERILRVKIA